MLLWLAGITAYTVVMVPVGTVLLAFMLFKRHAVPHRRDLLFLAVAGSRHPNAAV